jgi:uncharacterized protein
MNPIDIINEFYKPTSKTCEILITHSLAVAKKALKAAKRVSHLNPDCRFVEEAAMLHDIGIFYTNVASLGCTGEYPYVSHGYLGRKLLEDKGFNRHALVCERHVGVGLTLDEINKYNLPLPQRDAVPISIEEQIVCYADKFFSKKQNQNGEEQPVEAVLKQIEVYGKDKVERFKNWVELFE